MRTGEMKNSVIVVGSFLAFCIMATPHSQAQKGRAHPEIIPPPNCGQLLQDDIYNCEVARTFCLDNGTPQATCTAEYDQCTAEALARYHACENGVGAATTQPFLSLTPSALPTALNKSRQSHALLNSLAN
jgi:hypothetical protein